MFKHFFIQRRQIVDKRPPTPQPRMRWYGRC